MATWPDWPRCPYCGAPCRNQAACAAHSDLPQLDPVRLLEVSTQKPLKEAA